VIQFGGLGVRRPPCVEIGDGEVGGGRDVEVRCQVDGRRLGAWGPWKDLTRGKVMSGLIKWTGPNRQGTAGKPGGVARGGQNPSW